MLSSKQVASISGASLRQLQWWDEHGIIIPKRDGHSRQYTRAQAIEACVLVDARRRGFSLQRQNHSVVLRLLHLAGHSSLEYLVVDGNEVLTLSSRILASAIVQARPVLVIHLERHRVVVDAALRKAAA